MASFVGTSRRMEISLEKKVAEKDTEILSLKYSVKSAEDKFHQSSEREVQTSAKLNAAEAKATELEKKLQKEVEEKSKFKSLAKKSTAEIKELTVQVDHYKLAKYTEEVINIFQKLEDYQSESLRFL